MQIDFNITLDIHVGKNGRMSVESFGITPTKHMHANPVPDFKVKLETILWQSKIISDYLEKNRVSDAEIIDSLSGKLVWLIERLMIDYEAAQKVDKND